MFPQGSRPLYIIGQSLCIERSRLFVRSDKGIIWNRQGRQFKTQEQKEGKGVVAVQGEGRDVKQTRSRSSSKMGLSKMEMTDNSLERLSRGSLVRGGPGHTMEDVPDHRVKVVLFLNVSLSVFWTFRDAGPAQHVQCQRLQLLTPFPHTPPPLLSSSPPLLPPPTAHFPPLSPRSSGRRHRAELAPITL